MRSKITSFLKTHTLALLLLLVSAHSLSAQTISTPTKGENVGNFYTKICDFYVQPTTPPDPPAIEFTHKSKFTATGFTNPANQFILEMSDKDGNFNNLTNIGANVLTASGTFTFDIPTNVVGGQNFKLRVRSTSPAIIGPATGGFPIYYLAFKDSFSINGNISTALLCSGESLTLIIDTVAPTPISIPSLKYKWFRNGILISGQTGTSCVVNTTGEYQVKIDYGDCTDINDSYSSNKIQVTAGVSGQTYALSSSLPNPVCPANPTVLSVVGLPAGVFTYRWFRNTVEIPNATSATYSAGVTGSYTAIVSNGCAATTSTINVAAFDILASLNVPEVPLISKIVPTQTKTITVTTNAVNPTYQWFKNTVIEAETTSTYVATSAGNYSVIVTQNDACIINKQLFFDLEEGALAVKIPNIVSPNNDGKNDLWIIPDNYLTGTNTEVLIINEQGKVVLKTNSYQNDWPNTSIDFKNVNPIFYYIITSGQETKKGTITVIK
ncbi:gliding motility-associated C-terminal domain-containing protein [Flavobacterium sp.]|uniref:T9SS type B sorting domain-containing protein n=1 Tax=Flavobacterium sp. TaxID=239 RepID=UPI00286E4836|nr:gliding motility-associated C-terminal domain-containing protein [Flavobacterium sp.]